MATMKHCCKHRTTFFFAQKKTGEKENNVKRKQWKTCVSELETQQTNEAKNARREKREKKEKKMNS
jgi:hypothetical protein